MWLLLLIVHLTGMVGFNLSLRKSVLKNIDRFALATVMQIGIAVPSIFLLVFKTPALNSYTGFDFLLLTSIILLTIGLQVTNVKSLQYLEAGVYSVIYNLRILITTVLGILFLSEGIVWPRIAGGMLILLAIFIVRQEGSKTIRIRGVWWGIAAAFVISFLNLSEKLLIENVGVLNYFALAQITAAVIMAAYLFSRPGNVVKPSVLWQPRMLQLMAFRAVSAYGFTFALAAGALVSVANYIAGMSVILMVIFGALLLGEKDYLLRKAIATAVAVSGLTIIFLSHVLQIH